MAHDAMAGNEIDRRAQAYADHHVQRNEEAYDQVLAESVEGMYELFRNEG
jgi:hypothetical protein